MNTNLIAACFVIGALMTPAVSYAEDTDVDRSSAKTYVHDSVITTKVKAKLAEEKMMSLVHIKVDTDNKGVVWLSGTVKTQTEVDKVISIARGVEGVTEVKSNIKINPA
jgi:hyperosmotically inducible protein